MTAAFPGNSAVKSFRKSAKFAIAEPVDGGGNTTPPPAPVHNGGVWQATRTDLELYPFWTFTIGAGGTVNGISQAGGYTAICPAGGDVSNVNLALSDTFFVSTDHFIKSFHYENHGSGVTTDVTTTFDITLGVSTGTGTFTASGTYADKSCSATIPLKLVNNPT
ncbi:MAG: hypothetical protein QM648_11465 [Solirubrobacterales bacterium]